ncbi:hypothetical protein TNCV_3368141 [Trichonephila clavipes]|nr:hypothetical protein TNCV_3368141 [Trichonephila clavipes]
MQTEDLKRREMPLSFGCVAVTRHDAGRRRAVCNSSLEERILNVVFDRPKSSTRTVVHEAIDYLLRLPVDGTAMCGAAAVRNSCAE